MKAARMPEADPTEAENPPAPSYVGVVDRFAGGVVSGWGVTLEGDPCEIIIQIDGVERVRVISDQPRPDLAAKQQAKGQGGWSVDLGGEVDPSRQVIDVRFADGSALARSPVHVEQSPAISDGPITYVGAIDRSDRNEIAGWALSSRFEAASVRIQINEGPTIEVAADYDRLDLIAQQLTKSGGGWVLRVTDLLSPGTNSVAVVFPDGTHLPGSPIELPDHAPSSEPPTAAAVASPARIPSLIELDELSLDDISLAVAAGLIEVAPPAGFTEEPEQTTDSAEEEQPEPAERPLERSRSLLAWFLGRR